MFLGRWPHTLSMDPKNRVALPAPLRAASLRPDGSSDFVVGVLEDRCLFVHTPAQHEEFNRRLQRHLGDTRQSRRVKTYLASRFVAASADANGRVTVPQFLVDAAGITKEVVVIGQETRAEIWGVEAFAALERELAQESSVAETLERVFAEEELELREGRTHTAN